MGGVGNTTTSNTSTSPAHDACEVTEAGEHDIFIRVLLMLVMITAALNLAHYLHHKKFKYIGESAVYILLGLVISFGWTSMAYDPSNMAIRLNSHFFSLVLLPPIIFEGGFNLQRTSFFNNIIPILGLALVGAFYSTFVTSILMWAFSRILTEQGWTVIESLVFGSIISSTDPVTVLSLLPSNVDRRLYMLIFGESALNDAVSIILYRFFTGLQAESSDLGVLPFGVFLGSFCVGVIVAMVFAKITKHVWIPGYEGAIYEMVMLFIFAYSSYLLAEILSLTGIISIFFCGIAMSHYAYSNLTDLTQRTMKVTIRMICIMCEGFIFLYLGLGLLSFGTVYDPVFIIFALIAILISRSHVFIILSMSQFLPGQQPVPLNQQTLMCVAFALGVNFLDHPDFGPAIKGLIFGTTVMVVVATVLIFGGMTPYMLKWLKITPDDEPGSDGHGDHEAVAGNEQGANQSGDQRREVKYEEEENVITEEDLEQPVFGWLYRLDAQYIRPHLSHNAKDHIQALAAIHRRESRIQSRQSSMLETRLSVVSQMGGHVGGSGLVQSPMSISHKKREDEDDRAKLINKTNQAEEIALEAVSLN
ncbi:Sodium/hydrogen exchanger family-domain-containing protein [Entophlyctis helioformis]|nr:Sodium/hydrogen exchanger family-domain-containing protein [Entophlyctis helioformis]